ncbi:MFS transporter [Brevibacterium marinum]|uniref:DHA2 family methylenomycin A resistance protein-like MFS transporter n=1 Tax=Brevibacterium marinum TaxID=418643 RepID=A0A846S1P7_9MICO|nr:MFS transporter [Brevibacterium marinum]NJC55502.1 DHA2 family methylenomycin A resistance protein-like MFS transporter [Brevibacterium marinum]
MPRMLILGLCAGYFLVLLDVTVVNVALPQINVDLRAGQTGMAGVVNAYTFVLAALLLAIGAIGDRWGHRRIVIFGFLCFFLGSLACSLSPTIELLVSSRALQGVGAAATMTGTLAMLSESAADERERSRLVGLWAALGGIALPLGPLLGGLLVDVGNWRAVFWLNLPIILIAVIPILASSPRGGASRSGSGGRVRESERPAAPDSAPSAESAPSPESASGTGLPPVAAPSVSSSRARLMLACVVAAMMNFCVLGTLFLLTQFFQDGRGLSPLQAGLATLPALLPMPFFGALSSRVSNRLGVWRTSALGLVVGGIGLGLMGLTISGAGLWGLWSALFVWAVGVGTLTPAIVAAAMHALPQRSGFASGAGSTARNLGGALGVTVFAALHEVDTGVLMAGAGVAMIAAAFICIQVQRGRTQVSTVDLTVDRSEGSGQILRPRSPLSD